MVSIFSNDDDRVQNADNVLTLTAGSVVDFHAIKLRIIRQPIWKENVAVSL